MGALMKRDNRHAFGEAHARPLVMLSSVAASLLFLMHALSPSELLLALGALAMFLPLLLASRNELMMLVWFYVPNTAMFRTENGFTLLTFFIAAVLLRYVIGGRVVLSLRLAITMAFLAAATLVSSTLSDGTGLILPFLGFASLLMCVNSWVSDNRGAVLASYRSVFRWFVLGCASSVICGVTYQLAMMGELFGGRFSSVGADPNYYGLVMAFAVSLILVDLLESKSARGRQLVAGFLLLLSGLLSISRAFVISVAVNLVAVAALFVGRSGIRMMAKIAMLTALILGALVAANVMRPVLESYETRFTAENVITLGERTSLFDTYMRLWLGDAETTLFGLGDPADLYREGLVPGVQHNYYLEVVSSIGALGAIPLVFVYVGLWRVTHTGVRRIGGRRNPIILLPAMTLALSLLSLNALFSDVHLALVVLWMLQHAAYAPPLRHASGGDDGCAGPPADLREGSPPSTSAVNQRARTSRSGPMRTAPESEPNQPLGSVALRPRLVAQKGTYGAKRRLGFADRMNLHTFAVTRLRRGIHHASAEFRSERVCVTP